MIQFNNKNLIFCGDVHGEFETLVYNIKRLNISDSTIICCGDFGVGFYKPNYYINIFNKVSPYLIKNNVNIVALRGNHDNPSYFKENTIYNNCIYLVKDYEIINSCNYNILCIGGAISIDRRLRKLNVDYWIDENIKFDEFMLNDLSKNDNIDIIASHTAPQYFIPYTKVSFEFYRDDVNLEQELKDERLLCNGIFDIFSHTVTHWYYGHFHNSIISNYENVKYRCLDIMELYQHN